MAEFDAASKSPETYTFSDFNTNGDNKIDKTDRENSKISEEIWDALLNIKKEYDNVNDFEIAYEQVKFNLEAQKEMVEFREGMKNGFGADATNAAKEYNAFKTQLIKEYSGFAQEHVNEYETFKAEEGNVYLNYNKNVESEHKAEIKENINQLLNALKEDGAKGGMTVWVKDKTFNVNYNHKHKCLTYKTPNNPAKKIVDEPKFVDSIVAKADRIAGYSLKTSN